MEPPIPRSVVAMKPRCCMPGMILTEIQPTMKPIMIDQIMCNMCLFWLGAEAIRRGLGMPIFFALQDRQGGSAAPSGDATKSAASPPKLTSSKGLLDPPTVLADSLYRALSIRRAAG